MVIRKAQTKGKKYVKIIEQSPDGLCHVRDYVNGRLQASACNRTKEQALQLFDKQITEEKLYDNRSYEKVLV